MDVYTLLFLIGGILLTLIPLKVSQSIFEDSGRPLSIWTLLVPAVGITFIAVALLSYHKDDLRCLFYNLCSQIDQTGYGYGIGTALLGILPSTVSSTSVPSAPELTPLSAINIRE